VDLIVNYWAWRGRGERKVFSFFEPVENLGGIRSTSRLRPMPPLLRSRLGTRRDRRLSFATCPAINQGSIVVVKHNTLSHLKLYSLRATLIEMEYRWPTWEYPSHTAVAARMPFLQRSRRTPISKCKVSDVGPQHISSMRASNGAAAASAGRQTRTLLQVRAQRSLRAPKTGLCSAPRWTNAKKAGMSVGGGRADEDVGADGRRSVSGRRSARNSRSTRDSCRYDLRPTKCERLRL